ncbi:MAG: protein kinase, partial [Acidobacteriota bacterium]
MIGKTLGPYEILEQLGAGGMGQVYLGQDTRLGRRVAIKVLPAEFASDHERLARFEQEARAAAALNHPHIAVVHDVGSESGEDGVTTHFIVQEYLEGQSLRERLVVGALSVDKALSLAIEIGEALTAAHKAGIIHRDLKPDNVFVTAERHAKVLDFGLAKLTEAAPVSADLSMSPTMLGTVAGQVMGTAGYMAPEQAAGRTDIDHRADLFAFGCVFYEMLTGRQPFPGRSVAEILSRIQHEEPAPLADDKRSLPDSLQRVVDKCLAKDPDLRYQHADDMVVDLRRAKTVGIAGPPAADAGAGRGIPHGATGRRAVPVLVAVALAVVAALAGGWIARNMFRADAPDPVALTISLQDGLVIPTYRYNDALSRATIALSPDGELLAFVARRDGVGRLFLRDLRSYEIIEVPSSDRAMMPFFSPDGRQVGFMANGKLWRAAISGGVPVEIGNVTSAAVGASWGADGTIVYAPSYASRLWKIPAAGGVAEPLTTLRLEAGEASHRWPHVLPDGSGVLFSIKPSTAQTLNEGRIAIASLATGEYEVVLEGGTAARYIDGGYLAYAREGRLFAATFDLATRQVGSPVPVLENLVSHPTNGAAWFALASNGTIAWVPGKEVLARTELQWLTQDGTVIPFTLVDDVGGL